MNKKDPGVIDPKLLELIKTSEFTSFIQSILKRGTLSTKQINLMTNQDNIEYYRLAFTSKDYDKNQNYDLFETLGDITINKFVVWWAIRKWPFLFPQGVDIMSRLKSNLRSKEVLGNLGLQLGFFDYIVAGENTRKSERMSLCEDVFEAFMGVTELLCDRYFGMYDGNANVCEIMKSIFDDLALWQDENMARIRRLNYFEQYDPTTILKEIRDKNKTLNIFENIKEELVEETTNDGIHSSTVTRYLPMDPLNNTQTRYSPYNKKNNKVNFKAPNNVQVRMNVEKNGELYVEFKTKAALSKIARQNIDRVMVNYLQTHGVRKEVPALWEKFWRLQNETNSF